jgi:hypothetical protein
MGRLAASSLHRGARREETFENVLRNPLTFPAKPAISPQAQDLMRQLLVKDPAERLGSKTGRPLHAAAVKGQGWPCWLIRYCLASLHAWVNKPLCSGCSLMSSPKQASQSPFPGACKPCWEGS